MDTTQHDTSDPESPGVETLEGRIDAVAALDPVEAERHIADLVGILASLLEEPGGSD